MREYPEKKETGFVEQHVFMCLHNPNRLPEYYHKPVESKFYISEGQSYYYLFQNQSLKFYTSNSGLLIKVHHGNPQKSLNHFKYNRLNYDIITNKKEIRKHLMMKELLK